MNQTTGTNFQTFKFASLSVYQLYDILKLRSEVFVVEQTCIFQDMDDLDQDSYHVLCYDNANVLIAYARILPKGLAYPDYCSMGRIVTSPSVRGKKIGKKLVTETLALVDELIEDPRPMKIGAQSRLISFYEEFGFQPVGEDYIEDGILHRYMVLK
jgi:ElaA protein